LPLHNFGCTQIREADKFLKSSSFQRQELPYWGNPSTLPPRREELVQLLPSTLAGPLVHTSESLGRECSFIHVNFFISSFMGTSAGPELYIMQM